MRRSTFLLAGTAAMLAAPVAAQVSDFRLPPGPTPTPRVVGPLPDTPVPRASPTPAPTPTATTAAPAPSPAAPAATPTAGVPSPAATSQPRASGRGADNPPVPTASPSASAAPLPAPVIATPIPSATSSAAPQPAVAEPAAPPPEAPRGSWWPWIAVVFALAAAAIAGLFWLRRRVGPLGPVVVAEIERPRVPPAPALDPAPSPPAAPVSAAAPVQPPEPRADEAHPLHIAIELRKLSLTLMNATLGYRLTLMNAGTEPLRDISIAADLIGAHGSLPREAQLAGPDTELAPRHFLAGLLPGESGDLAGELRLPLSEVRPISQGRAQLLVPLARFRIAAEGEEPRCFTLVTGEPSPSGNGSIQPVRLDFGPRVYHGLAGRAF